MLAEKCRILRFYGSKPEYHHHVIGGNFRLDPLQAAILLVKLPYLDSQHEKRRANAAFYDTHLSNSYIKPYINDGNEMIYNQYTLRSNKRDIVIDRLTNFGIGAAIYYPVPLHLQACFSHLGYQEADFPEAEKASQEVFSIPIYAELSLDERAYVVECLNSI